MKRAKIQTIEIRAQEEDVASALTFVEDLLESHGISTEIVHETTMVCEALLLNLLEQNYNPNTPITITGQQTFGNIDIKINFEGHRYTPPEVHDDEVSIEGGILKGFDDKIAYSYHTGYNSIRISVRRSYRNALFFCLIGMMVAIAAYGLSLFVLNDNSRAVLLNDYVVPVEQLFTNAMLMVGAPVTFFSLLKNLTDTYIVAERNSSVRKLQATTLVTSVVAILLALTVALVLTLFLEGHAGIYQAYSGTGLERTFSEMMQDLMPSDIFEPFQTISPFPLIIVASLVTYAFCSVGKYFDHMKLAIDACYALFSRMLHVVMAALPFFCFVAVFGLLLGEGFIAIPDITLYVFVILASLSVLLLEYVIRLRMAGINIGDFFRKLGPLLRENYKIGSVIEAVPYNIRYCSRTYGMNRKQLEVDMPVLAQTNLDGNCFLIMLMTLLFIFISDTPVSWVNIGVIAILVLFLSFGAPNQPGSILIGSLIIINYLNASTMLPMAIYMEVFLGSVQNLTNVIGDIVTAAITDARQRQA